LCRSDKLDWSQCPAVETIPGKRSGAWVFRGTRTPVSTVFENLQDINEFEKADKLLDAMNGVAAFGTPFAQSATTS
jgi:uncharacterized protein (DUF433 family)